MAVDLRGFYLKVRGMLGIFVCVSHTHDSCLNLVLCIELKHQRDIAMSMAAWLRQLVGHH